MALLVHNKKLSPKYNPYFDINIKRDIAFGERGEEIIKLMLEDGQKIEVKTERDTWKRTGNFVIEYSYKGRPSGIAHTKADWWFHNFSFQGKLEFTLVFKTEELKERIVRLLAEDKIKGVAGGDNNNSGLYLIPISTLKE